MKNKITITNEYSGERVDKALPLLIENISRSFALELIKNHHVLVNGKEVKPSLKLKENDEIEYEIMHEENPEIIKQDIPLDIVYEDDDIVIIDKPQGMVVHPAAGHHDGTLVNALLYKYDKLSDVNGAIRPGIVHRIDKDTSGLIAICKNDFAHNFLSEQLKDHTMHREYYALVKGTIVENEGKIDLPIGRSNINRQMMAVSPHNGKEAITYFEVVERFLNYTLIKCRLKTGRTHQIRVHLSYIHHPIEGDNIYSKSKNRLYDEGQLLHAYSLTFIHPTTKKEVTFTSPLPKYFTDVLDKLRTEGIKNPR